MKVKASALISSWQMDRETIETVTDFIFSGSKITADGDCSHETKRCLLCGRKSMTNLDSILKSRDVTLPTKVCLIKAVVFPVVMYQCEIWTIKKADSLRIDTFELVGEYPWKPLGLQEDQISQSYRTSILNIHWRDWCWNWSANALATWCEEWLIGKDIDAEKDWRQEEKQTTDDEVVGWHYWLNGHEFEQAPGDGEGQGSLACCSEWGCRVRHDWAEP